jgi:hypothetical protein
MKICLSMRSIVSIVFAQLGEKEAGFENQPDRYFVGT